MIDGVEIRELSPIRDDRGELCEILRSDDPLFRGFGQVYYTLARAGVVKAWHSHRVQWDHLVAIGPPALIALYDDREGSPTRGEVMEVHGGREAPVLVRIPPGVLHGYMPDGDHDTFLINLPSELYDHDAPDEVRIDPFDNDIPFDWRQHGARRGG